MLYPEHLKESLERTKEQYPELYEKDRKKVVKILSRIHKMLDADFNPGAEEPLSHRERMHHQEGAEEIMQILTKEFGTEYEDIIFQEAKQHVIDDMGQFYTRSDYERPYFWDKWKLMNEDITCWI